LFDHQNPADWFPFRISKTFGSIHKLGGSQSLYELGGGAARAYIRYSKVHGGDRTFFGLRAEDLHQLEGYPSVVCFLWEGQSEPLIVPFSDYEDVFGTVAPAGDGQYKVQVYLDSDGTELYIARAGRFSVEGRFGWAALQELVDIPRVSVPDLSHAQVQTLLGAIGAAKKYDVWVPPADRSRLDWSVASRFDCRGSLPYGFQQVADVMQEVDVVWIGKGSSEVRALFEVEHSTPIYSGLLRFNDIHLTAPNLHATFGIVANQARRSLFVRQLSRPTFRSSGLAEQCIFMEYPNVFGWYGRLAGEGVT
ncbi:MAG TPA: hypothetical protein PLJ35_04535, partial [Anaerolineae bacterium]|nr:hypothetical protein [Anaerolineae bacterium]HOQ98069.1 hypothetical protein [Anaerolineae bacterium]HPL27417.1 hypothetical protein [Anaerolineae bacterium]